MFDKQIFAQDSCAQCIDGVHQQAITTLFDISLLSPNVYHYFTIKRKR